MKVERLNVGSPLFEEVLGLLPGYYREVESCAPDNKMLRVYLKTLVENGHVYCVQNAGFMAVDRHEDPFHSNGGYWIILIAYVVPEKRLSGILGRLLRTVKELHNGEIRAMSYRGTGADPVMAKRFKHIGNIYIV
jgi:hypothetical protein